MTRPALALAAAFVAATSLTNAAEANGIRLGFGMPLGSFVASPFSQGAQKSSRGPSNYERMCAQRDAKARAAKAAAAKREYAAKQEGAARREAAALAEARARKAKIAKAPVETQDVEIKTAKVETKAVTSEAAPTINIPEAPAKVAAQAVVADTEIATVGEIDDAARISDPKTATLQQVVTIEKEAASTVTVADKIDANPTKVADTAERICRRFSAVIGGLVDIPCE